MGWRPYNESEADIEAEERARLVLAERWRVEVVKLSETLYGVDWAIFRDGKLKGWVEFKRRKTRYPDLMLGAAKVWKLQKLARDSGKQAFVVVAWSDGLFYTEIADTVYEVVKGGNSRGQNGDIEPVVLLDGFKQV